MNKVTFFICFWEYNIHKQILQVKDYIRTSRFTWASSLTCLFWRPHVYGAARLRGLFPPQRNVRSRKSRPEFPRLLRRWQMSADRSALNARLPFKDGFLASSNRKWSQSAAFCMSEANDLICWVFLCLMWFSIIQQNSKVRFAQCLSLLLQH